MSGLFIRLYLDEDVDVLVAEMVQHQADAEGPARDGHLQVLGELVCG